MAEEEIKPEAEVKPEAVEAPKEDAPPERAKSPRKKERRRKRVNKTKRRKEKLARFDTENKEKFEEAVKLIQAGESFSHAAEVTGLRGMFIKEKCIERGIVSPFYSPKQKERAEKTKK